MRSKSPKSQSPISNTNADANPNVNNTELVPVTSITAKPAVASPIAPIFRTVAILLLLITVVVILSLLRAQLAVQEGANNGTETAATGADVRQGRQLSAGAAKSTTTPVAQESVKMAVPVISPTAPTMPTGTFEASAKPNAPEGKPNPLFAPNYKPDDGLPVYVCGADAFASYLTLMQIQVMGADVANGFHLGVVPYSLNDQGYGISQQQADKNLNTGVWDCELNTVDSVARTSYGVVTAIVDESAGGDGMWARKIASIYDLKGKRIAFVRETSSEFFVRYALLIAQLNPAKDVTLLPFDTMEEAIDSFNANRADAVSGWEPNLSEAGKSGGNMLVSTDQLRVIVDAVVTSRRSIATKPDTVQAFHNAWFAAIKVQTDYFDIGAAEIAAWGNNEWSGISTEKASDDLRGQLDRIAQATLADNAYVMKNMSPILSHMTTARRVWAAAGVKLPNDKVESLVDARFVEHAAMDTDLQSSTVPVNNSFSLANPPTSARSANGNTPNATLAVLPCRRFSFLPDSTDLTAESRRVLDLCVLPAMQQRVGVSLLIRGSAAWPGPKGTFSESDILGIAQARAQAIANYLVSQKIDIKRLMIEGVLPPKARQETLDVAKQSIDRYVEMTLVAGQ